MLDEDLFNGFSAHAEFIPVISEEEEEFLLHSSEQPDVLPILPLRENVLFPGVVLPIAVSRKRSLRLLKEADRKSLLIGVVTQSSDVEEPQFSDVYTTGVMARCLKVFDIPSGPTMAVVQGLSKFQLNNFIQEDPYLMGSVSHLSDVSTSLSPKQFKSLVSSIRKKFQSLSKIKDSNSSLASNLKNIGSDKILINFIAAHLDISTDQKQQLLESPGYVPRATLLSQLLDEAIEYFHVTEEVQKKARMEMDRQQREYFLNQQMHVIQDELGGSPTDQDVAELLNRAAAKKWSSDIADFFAKEVQKLQRMAYQSPDYSVQVNYLDLLLSLPWNVFSNDNLKLDHARKVLDKDHYGIEKVKDRILEHIAVLSLKGDMKSPILCLVGPPGTGKTSLGKSIASALGRKYVRVALGGMHDESEIRGHRRTYIGSMPGRIIQSIKKAGTSNPVFVLDEIDKVQGQSLNGDPTSALLEVLDPEQNSAFHDNYLDVDYDLSNVLFIATANSLSTIQPALLDRMEVIELSGYILEEKIEIARRHLIPHQLKEHGFKRTDLKFSPALLSDIINNYTRESGVRQLDKTIAKIIRRRAVKKANDEPFAKTILSSELEELLGLPIHNSDRRGDSSLVGVVTGLAWTQVGGEILFIEACLSKGKGSLSLTGNLGDVMKESATLAFEYIKSNAEQLSIDQHVIDESNLHIHVPEGATPKDGPSAGVTIFVAMVSAFTKRPVRADYAMTGEITLRGRVTPVGGIREKILAAKRAGITDIVLCHDNRRDVEDVKADYLQGLSFHYVNDMSEALDLMLL